MFVKKFIIGMSLIAVLVAIGFLGYAQAAESPVSWNVSVTPVSNYIWRGQKLNANQAAIQPSVTVGLKNTGLSANLWGSIDNTTRPGTSGMLGETDLTVDWTGSAGFAESTGSLGAIYYTFPNLAAPNTTFEIYGGLGFPNAPFTPTAKVFYDMQLGTGAYITVAGAQPFMVANWPFTAGLSAGYNIEQFITGSTLSDINLSLGTAVTVAGLSISPSLVYTIVPDSMVTAATAAGLAAQTQLWGGVTVGMAF